jgi:hypothetical protein
MRLDKQNARQNAFAAKIAAAAIHQAATKK